jgi:hypothetical protein
LLALGVAPTTFAPVVPAARAFTPISGTASAPTASTSTPIITALFIFIFFLSLSKVSTKNLYVRLLPRAINSRMLKSLINYF